MAFGEGTRRGERGQVLVIFAGIFVVIMLVGAAAVDYGMWLAERRGIARSTDLAALAAAQDLPVDPLQNPYTTQAQCGSNLACNAAYDWAENNGFGEGDGATVIVEFMCNNRAGIPGVCQNTNPDEDGLSACPAAGDIKCDAVRVRIEKTAMEFFSLFFGGVGFDISYTSFSAVTFKAVETDTALIVDGTTSMFGSPITQATIGARNFKDILLRPDNPFAQVGYAPFRGCYDPPRGGLASGRCVPAIQLGLNNGRCNNAETSSSLMMCLGSYSAPNNHSQNMGRKIGPTGGFQDTTELPSRQTTGTNVCQALEYGRIILDDSPRRSDDPDRQRFIVILTDGDNFWDPEVFSGSSPVSQCRASSTQCPVPLGIIFCNPVGEDNPTGCGDSSTPRERQLDVRTRDLATLLKGDGDDPDDIEIFVIAFDVCNHRENQEWPNVDPQPGQFPTNSYCNGIGNSSSDNTADRRLLKCIASSTPGTNDHYFEVENADELPDLFQTVAFEIASRGLSPGP